MTNKCIICGGKVKYYHGVLGYESFRCEKCGAEFTHAKAYDKSGTDVTKLVKKLEKKLK